MQRVFEQRGLTHAASPGDPAQRSNPPRGRKNSVDLSTLTLATDDTHVSRPRRYPRRLIASRARIHLLTSSPKSRSSASPDRHRPQIISDCGRLCALPVTAESYRSELPSLSPSHHGLTWLSVSSNAGLTPLRVARTFRTMA